MFRPPFTLLVVKEGHQPFTVRITRRLLLTGAFVLLLLTGMFAYGIYWHVTTISSSGYQPLFPEQNDPPEFTVNENPALENDDSPDTQSNAPAIAQLSVDQGENDTTGIEFEIRNLQAGKLFYVWIILNPETGTAGETVIFPRSPLFRGMPVDYRNGIRYVGNQPELILAEFARMKIGVDFGTFRILAYDADDVIVIDKTYSIQNSDGK